MTGREETRTLLNRARASGWTGADPYDGLLSAVGRVTLPLGPIPRFAVSQAVLRFPAVRRALKPSPSVNSKALALFLGTATRQASFDAGSHARGVADELIALLSQTPSKAGTGLGWGYPFPWQSRSFWAPAGTPNAVVTATVGWHLLDAAERLGSAEAKRLGLAAADFLATGLRLSVVGPGSALSYTAKDRTQVVNISALAARLIARAARVRGNAALVPLAESLTRFVVSAQRPDGSWPYATEAGGAWEDSFHTGYVVESLLYLREMDVPIPDSVILRGVSAYDRFFTPEGAARLWADRDDVLDAHSAAQGVLTFAALASSSLGAADFQRDSADRAIRIAEWAARDLWVADHFAYRIVRGHRDEREFIRWVGAWMALAMATVAGIPTGARAHATAVPTAPTPMGVA